MRSRSRSAFSLSNIDLATLSSSEEGRLNASGIALSKSTTVTIPATPVIAFTIPTRRNVPCQNDQISIKCITAHAKTKKAINANVPCLERPVLFFTKEASAIRINK